MAVVLHLPLSIASNLRRRARSALALALGFGVASTALFWRAEIGLNFLVWSVVAMGLTALAFGGRSLRPVAVGAIALVVAFGFAIVRFQSVWTLAIAAPSALVCIGILPILLRDGSTFTDLGGLPTSVFHAIKRAPGAAVQVVRLPDAAFSSTASPGDKAEPGRVGSAMRGVLIGVPIAGAFALLFASDQGFRGALGSLGGRGGDALVFACEAVVVALVSLVAYFVHTRETPVPPAREDAFDPYRAREEAPRGLRERLRVSPLTWGIVEAQVVAVFAVFVVANARQLFGGAEFVRDDTSTTYASYLHAGFGQLLLATVLAVCVVLAGQTLVVSDGTRARSRALVALDVLIVGCAGLTLASCYQRLSIYVDAYGASHQRLGVAVVMLVVAGVLALTLVRSVLARWRGYPSALVVLTLGSLALASHVDADARVARMNLDRAARGAALDVRYLGGLTPDALSALDHPYLADHPDVALEIERRICGAVPRGDWRSFRGFERCPARAL